MIYTRKKILSDIRFINREKELEILEREYRKKQSSFVVIYGRRTGKTTLIEKFQLERLKSFNCLLALSY